MFKYMCIYHIIEQIVMESGNLEDNCDDESDDEDSEVDDEQNDEFEGVLKQVQNNSCHQQTDVYCLWNHWLHERRMCTL